MTVLRGGIAIDTPIIVRLFPFPFPFVFWPPLPSSF